MGGKTGKNKINWRTPTLDVADVSFFWGLEVVFKKTDKLIKQKKIKINPTIKITWNVQELEQPVLCGCFSKPPWTKEKHAVGEKIGDEFSKSKPDWLI